MIEVKKIPIQTVAHYDPNDNFLGFLTEEESTDLRTQIAEEKVEGYYLIYNNIKYNIKNSGQLESWPEGLYDSIIESLSKIFKFQIK